MGSLPLINNSGTVVFEADLNGPGVVNGDRRAYWKSQNGTLTMVARGGSHPANVAGVTLGANLSLQVNDQGKVAFVDSLIGAQTGTQAIFAEGPNGLQLVANANSFRGRPRRRSDISSIGFAGPNYDARDAFSDTGLLAFQATFTDGSTGVFVADTNSGQPPQLFGDFNNDGVVGAADYVVWRKGFPQTYSQNMYNIWRHNFGATQYAVGTSSSCHSQSQAD